MLISFFKIFLDGYLIPAPYYGGVNSKTWLYGELQPVHVPLFSEVTFWLFVYFNRHFTRSSPKKKKNAREYKGKKQAQSITFRECLPFFFSDCSMTGGWCDQMCRITFLLCKTTLTC